MNEPAPPQPATPAPSRTLGQLRLVTLGLLAGIVVLEILLGLIPVPGYIPDHTQFRLRMGITAILSFDLVAAALLFVYGLRDFKPEMRRSYQIIALSVAFFGITNLQYPILIFFNLIPGPWLSYGGSIIIIISGISLHYVGNRHFAKTLGINTKFTSWAVLWATTAIGCASVIFIPHHHEIPESWYQIHQIACTFDTIWNLFITGILVRSLQEVGPAYGPALRWLAAGSFGSALGFVQVFIVAATIGQNSAYNLSGLTAIPFAITGLFYITSGYLFCKIRFYGLGAKDHATSGRPILDAVINAARLASNRRDIEGLLERVRAITASLAPGQSLSPTNQQALIQIYLQIEDYLISRERLRSFTREGLRARLSIEAAKLLAQ